MRKDFYQPSTDGYGLRNIQHNPDSGFSYNGETFREITGEVFIDDTGFKGWDKRRGWFEFSYYTPMHEEFVINTRDIIDRIEHPEKHQDTPKEISDTDRYLLELFISASLVTVLGEKGLDMLQERRDLTGQYERVSIINIHGGRRNPWVVSTTPSGPILGTTQGLLDTFLGYSPNTDRVVLMICNNQKDTSLYSSRRGVFVNYILGDNGYSSRKPTHVEITADRKPVNLATGRSLRRKNL